MSELDVFAIALEMTDPAARAAYLDRACGEDRVLRQRIELLLRTHAGAGSFLARPAVEPVATEPADGPPPLTFLQPPGQPGSLGRLGHYEVLAVLGHGGFGVVLKALDDRLRRVVAIKVLSPSLAATSPARKRFLREARAAAAVKHDNVVQVYDVEEQPVPYLVMEYVSGQTLQQRLDEAGPLDLADVLTLGRQTAEGLAAAHATGLVHRDVKPANILIESGVAPRVKLTDFGLARAADDASLTQSGAIVGTPLFMSPEQAHGDALDARSDLFSLGSVLYAMVSGRPPFRAANTLAVLRRVAEDMPRPIREITPETPAWLCELIARLHAKRPEDRVQTAREVAESLAAGQTPRAGRPARASRPPCPQRRGRLALAVLLAAFGLLLLGGLALGLGGSVRWETAAVLLAAAAGVPLGLWVIGRRGRRVSEPEPPRPRHGLRLLGFLFLAAVGGVLLLKGCAALETPFATPHHPASAPAIGNPIWEQSLADLPTDEQIRQVKSYLRAYNPTFRDEIKPTVEGEAVTGLEFRTEYVQRIDPVRGLPSLERLIVADPRKKGNVPSLVALTGMRLKELDCSGNPAINDLSPLREMPLEALNVTGCAVTDFSPLRDLPLKRLDGDFVPARDAALFRSIPTLQRINGKPAAEFGKGVGARLPAPRPVE